MSSRDYDSELSNGTRPIATVRQVSLMCIRCEMMSAVLRETANKLMEVAGGRLGATFAGPAGAYYGEAIGQQLAEAVDVGAHKLVRKKRKVSKYQKHFGRQLKQLKDKHPQTKMSVLMKRAHKITKKAMKGELA